MPHNILFVSVLYMFCIGLANAGSLQIKINEPQNGSLVSQRHDVAGTVSDSDANIFVVIHPVTTSDFWVQPPVTVNSDGSWKVRVYFGRSGMDKGAEFEVRAFANPSDTLYEGKTVNWPKAAARSDVIDVTRK